MSIDSIVNVTITANSRGVARKSFGIPLVIGYHTNWLDTYKVYDAGTVGVDLVADGFATSDPVYIAATGTASATPKVEKIAVGRLATAFAQTGTLTVKAGVVEAGKVFSFDLIGPDGTVTPISYTAVALDGETEVATALAAQLTAVTDFTATSALAVVSWEADNNGEMWRLNLVNEELLEFEDTTIDSSLESELIAIQNEYNDWYGLLLADAHSTARNLVLAGYIETQDKLFGALSFDANNGDSGSTTSLSAVLNSGQYFRTYGFFTEDQASHAAATFMGTMFPIDPGSATWAYKALSGVQVSELSSNFVNGLETNYINYYIETAGLALTIEGQVGSGEWIDTVRGRDWLTARLQERLIGLLANNPKVPYTDAGIELIAKEVRAQLVEGITQRYLAAEPEPIVTVPLAADVSDQDKKDRILRNVNFEATLAGAIHSIRINGVLKV